MPSLLSLPNELLDHIIDEVHIDDIEAFSSCCKHVQRLAAVRLKEHLARKLNFPAVDLEPKEYPKQAFSYNRLRAYCIPVSSLKDFLMDEKNTLYPRSMSIKGIDKLNINQGQLSTLITTYLEQHHGLEDKIVAKVMQIQKILYSEMPAVEAEVWIDRIKQGESDATAALLITLFPNVKRLTVSDCPALPEGLWRCTLEKMILSAAKHGSRAIGAFKELSEVYLNGTSHRDADGRLIAVFMDLPSMRVIKGYRTHWRADDPLYRPLTSNVKEISMECSDIGSELLLSCLERIATLEKFTYNMVPSRMRRTTNLLEPRLIVKALSKYAGRTLVHLEITGQTDSVSLADEEPFIATLRSFQVLENIRLMTMMLFKKVEGEDTDESGVDTDESEGIVESDLEDIIEPNPLVEPRSLVDFLPSSAKRLKLVGGISDEEARDMFADLPLLKLERVPKLGEIVLEDSDPLEQETKGLCRNAGIRLKSIKRVENGYQRTYAVTKPAPQVDGLEH